MALTNDDMGVISNALLADDDGVPPEPVQAALEALDRLLQRLEKLEGALHRIVKIPTRTGYVCHGCDYRDCSACLAREALTQEEERK